MLPINQGGQVGPAGTNVFRTNIVAGTGVSLTYGTNGEVTINSSAGMSILASNFFAMGISNILAGPGIALGTNGGVLWITNTALGGAFNANQFSATTVTNIKTGVMITNLNQFGSATNTGDFWLIGNLDINGGITSFVDPLAITVGGTTGFNIRDSSKDIYPINSLETMGWTSPFRSMSATNFVFSDTNFFLGLSNGYIYMFASNRIVLSINTTNGNVGINTNTPAQALEVQGNVNISGNQTNSGTIKPAILQTDAGRVDANGIFTVNTGTFGWASSLGGARNVTLYRNADSIVGTTNLFLNGTNQVAGPASVGMGATLWTDGTNLCIILQNSAGTRTTNKVSTTAWP